DFTLKVQDAEAVRKHKPKPARFQLELASSPKTPAAGQTAELKFVIRDREAPGSVYSTFERVHEKLLHLVIVRTDLAEFAHEHPQLGQDGIFRLDYAFRSGGEYHLFAEVAPRGAGAQVMMAKLRVSGKSTPANVAAAADFAPVPAGRMVTLRFPAPVAELEP